MEGMMALAAGVLAALLLAEPARCCYKLPAPTTPATAAPTGTGATAPTAAAATSPSAAATGATPPPPPPCIPAPSAHCGAAVRTLWPGGAANCEIVCDCRTAKWAAAGPDGGDCLGTHGGLVGNVVAVGSFSPPADAAGDPLRHPHCGAVSALLRTGAGPLGKTPCYVACDPASRKYVGIGPDCAAFFR